ncbi:hypothetical protein KIH77_03465 [Bifidobacterium sp. 82T24]|uniref:hypothetical protein n=1 Tax=Bifidobacterium pluvialisilvae TaxID=2834436 RepID=UPI001C5697B5|nr:hypothetical protein [Bifidobacterium pluvialisilvae]MBW3087794.1 hypothetical protein [Bifidobacterium pluvialisilvae]
MMNDTPQPRRTDGGTPLHPEPEERHDVSRDLPIDALGQLQALRDLDADRLNLAQRGQRGHTAMLLPFAVLGFIVIMLYWPFGLMFGGYIEMTWTMLFAFLVFAILSIAVMLLLMQRYQRRTGMATYFGGRASRKVSMRAWRSRTYATTYVLVIAAEIGIPWLAMAWGYHGGTWPVAALIALIGSLVIYLLLRWNMRLFFRMLSSPAFDGANPPAVTPSPGSGSPSAREGGRHDE